jgi:cobalt-zinc-cadmium efflux system protein
MHSRRALSKLRPKRSKASTSFTPFPHLLCRFNKVFPMKQHHPESGRGTTDRRLWASAALNLGVTIIECAGGLWAGSLALLSDAAHNLADVGALGLAIFARRLGRRASTPRHTYGLKRAEVVAALLNAVLLIAISTLIGREAVGRFFHPAQVQAPVMMIAAAVAVVANVASVLLLRKHRAEDINVRSAFLHLAQDALASLAVLVAALFAGTPAGSYLDPAAAILIGMRRRPLESMLGSLPMR